MRKRALLALSLPLASAGSLAGHAVGYAVAGSGPQDTRIHGYLGYTPQFLVACAALASVALSLRVTGRLRGRPAAWPFALLPPIAFVGQELLERILNGLSAHAAFEPAVWAGLAAQLPFAVVAYLAARALLRGADALARALAPPVALTNLRPAALPLPAGALRLAETPLALDRLGRAPPRR